jgi:type IV pilus assembly protein PilA
MLRKLTERLYSSARGFSLIEVLVVILVIGILAAIALPLFIGERSKGQDADAKSNARNLVSGLESYYATEREYDGAKDSEEITRSGIEIGAGKGQAELSLDDDTYTIVAHSQSGTKFTIEKDADGKLSRTCDNGGDGGCPSDGKW